MPYSSVEDLPESVRSRLKPKKQRQWLAVWNSSFEEHKDEGRAFAAANAAVKKAVEMVEKSAEAPADDSRFNFFMPICKVDKERRTVSGYASTEALDCDGEKVSREAIKSALPGYWGNIREMHKTWAVGVAKEANLDAKGLFLTAKIVDDEAWKKVDEGVYKGFSIGGKKLKKEGETITKLDLVEISIVDRPANPECRFTVQKSASIPDGTAAEAHLLPIEEVADQISIQKLAEVVDKARKVTKSLKKIAKREKPVAGHAPTESASAPFLTLDADGGAEAVLGKVESSHELDLGSGDSAVSQKGDKKSKKLAKRMSTAGSLAYAFDSLRSVQRNLLLEARQEGGDRRDRNLANKLGEISNSLGEVIAQKATHEGQEALSLTDAEDMSFFSIYGEDLTKMSEENKGARSELLGQMVQNWLLKAAAGAVQATQESPVVMLKAANDALKAAKKDRDEMEECVKVLFDAHKAAFLHQASVAKAGKKDDKSDDKPFDHESAMKMLKSVFAGLTKQKELTKAVRAQLKKAASRISGDGTVEDPLSGVYDPPDGLRLISPGEMDNLRAAKAAKGDKSGDVVSKSEAELMVKAAVAEAKSELLSRLPAGGGAKPYNFDMTKVAGAAAELDPTAAAAAEFFKGANPANLAANSPPEVREAELSKLIGNRILNGGGRPVFDPTFHGTGGIDRAVH